MICFLNFVARLLCSFAALVFFWVGVSCSNTSEDYLAGWTGGDKDEEVEVDGDENENENEDEGLGTEDEEVADPAGEDGILKILAIGNSFTQDCVEQYLWELFDAAGIEAVVANLYIGGCNLETHYNNAVANSAAYSYRKIVNGQMTTRASTSMLYGIKDENWDIICFHQLSSLFASLDNFYPYLPYLMEYATNNATNEDMKIAFQLTWAYPEGSTQSGFENYGSDQLTMYNTIVSTVQQLDEDLHFDLVIPVGTAVQNGRNSWLGDTFNRDSQHLNYSYGRFTGSCTWFEKISGIDVTTTTYAPEDVTDDMKDVVIHAAHFAVENPYEINPMTEWQDDPRPKVVEVRELYTDPTSVTVAWNVDGCEEQEASTYAYDFAIYKDEACSNLIVKWSSDAATGSGNGGSIWRPGNTARVWFTFSALEPSTDYWVKVNIQGNPDSTSEPLKVTTEKSFGSELNVVSENAQVGDVILVEGFDKLIHGSDDARKAEGVIPSSSNRSTLVVPEGENPQNFSLQRWYAATFSPFPYSGTGVGVAYTEAAGLSDWCTGASAGTTLYTHPGYIQVGTANGMGYIATPELKAIPEGKRASVKVEFQGQAYHYSSWYCDYIVVGVVDGVEPDSNLQVSSWTSSADNGEQVDSKNVSVPQEDYVFQDLSADLSNVTNTSRIRFASYSSSAGRFMLDNIVITITDLVDVGSYGVLSTPTNVAFDESATSDVTLTLTWDTVSGADSYMVKYWAEGNEDDALTESTGYSPLVLSGLESGTTYYAQVMACSDGGEQYNSEYSVAVFCKTDPQKTVYVREISTEPTSVTVAWNVDGCEEQDATYYAYDFAIYKDEACSNLIVKWSSDAATGTGNGGSIWRPGSTARVWFTFSALEPSTDYWVKVNIQGNPNSANEPFKVTTEPAFGADLTIVSEDAKAGDVILVEGFDKLVHSGDPLHKAVGVIPDVDNRETLVIPEGDNPSGFSLQNWRVLNDATATFSPFHYTRSGNVGTEYTIESGLSDWCSGVSTSGTVMSPRPGYMVMGVTTYMGHLGTPELKAIPEGKTAKVKVEFQAMPYHYSSWDCQQIMVAVVDNVVPDSSTWQVSAWGNREDNGVLTDSKIIDLVQSDDAFEDYSIELDGVTSSSRIRISGYDYNHPVFLLDNIVITVVDIQ